jgi:hypothetical protein
VAGLRVREVGELVDIGILVGLRCERKRPRSSKTIRENAVLAAFSAPAGQEIDQGDESDDDRCRNGDNRDGGDGQNHCARGVRLPGEASPANEAKEGQHNNDDDDDPEPGHVALS